MGKTINLSEFIGKATRYQIQYIDYKDGEWTVPTLLTKERADRFLKDLSVKKLRLITIDNKVFELDIK